MSDTEYWIIQDSGFNSGYIKDGPYDNFPQAYKAKNKLEQTTLEDYRVHEGEP